MKIHSTVMEVEVLPEVGGKIAQIRDLRDGRNWLIPPQRPLRTLESGTRWMDYDTSGMDDCWPNIEACTYPGPPWKGAPLPQLGDWAYGTWEVTDHSPAHVTLRRDGEILPYRALKTIRVAESRVEVQYRLGNVGRAPFQYMWAAHPLIAAGPAFRLTVAPGEVRFVTFPPDGRVYTWPDYGSIDLSKEWIPPGKTLKIFLTGLSQGWCGLDTLNGRVEFTFDLTGAPVLGLWFNHRGFPAGDHAFQCIAVEPCTATTDVLEAGTDRVLVPGHSVEWSVQLQFRRA